MVKRSSHDSVYQDTLRAYYTAEVNRIETFKRLRVLAHEGRAKALLLLSMMYRDGDGVERDEAASRGCLDELMFRAEGGDSEAAYEVGMGHLWGDQYPCDWEKGRRLMLLAAKHGNADAQYELSNYLSDGAFDFGVDEGLAKRMLVLSVEQEHVEAMYNYAILLMRDSRTEEAIVLLRKAAPCHSKAREVLSTLLQ